MRTIMKELGSNMPEGVEVRLPEVLGKYKLSFRFHSVKFIQKAPTAHKGRIYSSLRDHEHGQISMEYSSPVNTVDCVETLAGHMGECKTTECTDHHT